MKVKEVMEDCVLYDIGSKWRGYCRDNYIDESDIFKFLEEGDEVVGFRIYRDEAVLNIENYVRNYSEKRYGEIKEEDINSYFLKKLKGCEDYDEWDLNDIVDLLASTDFYIDVASEYFDELGFELKFDDDEPYYDQHYYVVVK